MFVIETQDCKQRYFDMAQQKGEREGMNIKIELH